MQHQTQPSDSLFHAGAGTAQVLTLLGLIPGFLPALALTVLITAVVVAPVVVLGLAVVLISAPFYLASRVLRRDRRHRRRQEHTPVLRPVPVPTPHAS